MRDPVEHARKMAQIADVQEVDGVANTLNWLADTIEARDAEIARLRGVLATISELPDSEATLAAEIARAELERDSR